MSQVNAIFFSANDSQKRTQSFFSVSHLSKYLWYEHNKDIYWEASFSWGRRTAQQKAIEKFRHASKKKKNKWRPKKKKSYSYLVPNVIFCSLCELWKNIGSKIYTHCARNNKHIMTDRLFWQNKMFLWPCDDLCCFFSSVYLVKEFHIPEAFGNVFRSIKMLEANREKECQEVFPFNGYFVDTFVFLFLPYFISDSET